MSKIKNKMDTQSRNSEGYHRPCSIPTTTRLWRLVSPWLAVFHCCARKNNSQLFLSPQSHGSNEPQNDTLFSHTEERSDVSIHKTTQSQTSEKYQPSLDSYGTNMPQNDGVGEWAQNDSVEEWSQNDTLLSHTEEFSPFCHTEERSDVSIHNNNTASESGRSMVEILGVLAIIGILSITAIAGYSYAMSKNKMNKILSGLSMAQITIFDMIKSGTEDIFLAADNSLSNLSRNVLKTGHGLDEYNPVGMGCTEDTYDIVLNNVPVDVCKMLISEDIGMYIVADVRDNSNSNKDKYCRDLNNPNTSCTTTDETVQIAFTFETKTGLFEKDRWSCPNGENADGTCIGVCPGYGECVQCNKGDSVVCNYEELNWADKCTCVPNGQSGACNYGECITCPSGEKAVCPMVSGCVCLSEDKPNACSVNMCITCDMGQKAVCSYYGSCYCYDEDAQYTCGSVECIVCKDGKEGMCADYGPCICYDKNAGETALCASYECGTCEKGYAAYSPSYDTPVSCVKNPDAPIACEQGGKNCQSCTDSETLECGGSDDYWSSYSDYFCVCNPGDGSVACGESGCTKCEPGYVAQKRETYDGVVVECIENKGGDIMCPHSEYGECISCSPGEQAMCAYYGGCVCVPKGQQGICGYAGCISCAKGEKPLCSGYGDCVCVSEDGSAACESSGSHCITCNAGKTAHCAEYSSNTSSCICAAENQSWACGGENCIVCGTGTASCDWNGCTCS